MTQNSRNISKITNEHIIFYGRWVNKANKYKFQKLSDVFDNFITQYIIFNYLYNLASELKGFKYTNIKGKRCKYPQRGLDGKKSTEIPQKLLSNNSIFKDLSINQNTKIVLGCLENSFVLASKNDKLVLTQLNSKNPAEKERGILQMIYQTRCNLFHGEKFFQESQKEVLIPCIKILKRINQMMWKALIEEFYISSKNPNNNQACASSPKLINKKQVD